MRTLRATYDDAAELRRALDHEIARGVLLVKGTPPEGIQFRETVTLQVEAPGGSIAVEAEVVSILPGVGVAVTFPPARVPQARALLDAVPVPPASMVTAPETPAVEAPAVEAAAAKAPPAETPAEAAPAAETAAAAAARATTAEKIQLALHGSREDRAAILRDQNRSLHAYVLKSPQVTLDEVTAWAKNPQTNVDFLKQIGERKDWLSRPAIAQALVRNPRTPPELAVRALDHVPVEALRQMAKGSGVPPHVVQAARKKVIK